MKIAHYSDTHSNRGSITAVANVDCDVIVLTGDILANKGRVFSPVTGTYRINAQIEAQYQRTWSRRAAKKWAVAFKGRPVVYVPGNHDFVGIESWLKHYGHEEIYTLSESRPFVDVLGKRFAGFREIPWIDGEWVGETRDFHDRIAQTMAHQPDILVTHAPPAGILSGDDGYGIPGLVNALFYNEHRITHHLFGHEHSCGGQVVTEGGITFSNAAAACTPNMLEVA